MHMPSAYAVIGGSLICKILETTHFTEHSIRLYLKCYNLGKQTLIKLESPYKYSC